MFHIMHEIQHGIFTGINIRLIGNDVEVRNLAVEQITFCMLQGGEAFILLTEQCFIPETEVEREVQ